MILSKSKSGLEAAGFSIIAGLILLLLSGAIILALVKNQASKVDEKLQVDLCRISNEIKFGLIEKTSGIVSGPQICNTIDKTDKKLQIPTKKYTQDNKGAETEIREMIKNCWYMWLDGSQKNTFEKYPFSKGCFTCYSFKMSKEAEGVTFSSLSASLSEPFFASDKSDQCAPYGGYWRTQCNQDERKFESKKTPPGANYKCCVKDIRNECENKGGKCSSTGSPNGFPKIYSKWSCPGRGETCYIADESIYSFVRYIREYGSRGGDILFIPPGGKEATDMNFVPGERYAISFVSPSETICTKGEGTLGGAGCIARMGAYAVGAAAGGVGLYVFGSSALAAGGSILKFIGISGAAGVAGAGVVAGKAGILDWAARSFAEFAVSGITVDVPNFIIVSTEQDAKQLECTLQYAGQ